MRPHVPAAPIRRQGVNLLELLLACAALAVIAAVVVPWGRAAMAAMQAERAADSVADAMAEARGMAMVLHRPVRLLVNETGNSVEVDGGTFRRLPAAVRLSGPPREADGSGVIRFAADGGSDGGQVLVSSPSIAWWLSVDGRSGQVRRIAAGGVR